MRRNQRPESALTTSNGHDPRAHQAHAHATAAHSVDTRWTDARRSDERAKDDNTVIDRERVRTLVLEYGWNSTCYQLLNPGIRYWFSGRTRAAIGFVEYAGVRIVAGAPVCDLSELAGVVREFESDAREQGLSVCYFASEARLEACIGTETGYSAILLGAQPVWEPATLVRTMSEKPSLRTQLHRSWNKGVTIEERSAVDASRSPELQHALESWLQTRGLPSLHFLVEPQTLRDLGDRRIFVAERKGVTVGFLNLAPIPQRNGWLVEQFVRTQRAPNGTIELLLNAAAERVAKEGARYITLGLSPLSQMAGSSPMQTGPLIPWLLHWARAHGKRFYNFGGLEFFKSKFEPELWEPIYSIANTPRYGLKSLYAIACAFTNGKPVSLVLRGIARAIRQEIEWLGPRDRSKGGS